MVSGTPPGMPILPLLKHTMVLPVLQAGKAGLQRAGNIRQILSDYFTLILPYCLYGIKKRLF
jgi:hypothetical protein